HAHGEPAQLLRLQLLRELLGGPDQRHVQFLRAATVAALRDRADAAHLLRERSLEVARGAQGSDLARRHAHGVAARHVLGPARACAAVRLVVKPPTEAAFASAIPASTSCRNPRWRSSSRTTFSATRRSAETTSLRTHGRAGAAMPMFCSAMSTMVRGKFLRAI